MKFRKSLVAAVVALAGLALPSLAAAHFEVSPTEVAAEGETMLEFTVPHGCDGAATNKVTIKLPSQVVDATPEAEPGWTIKSGEGSRQIIWAGGPLPDKEIETFGLSVDVSGKAGETAEFKIIQGCVGGVETAWIQTEVEGQPEPEHPAPAVTLVAGGEDMHAAGTEEDHAHEGDKAGESMAAAETASASESSSDSDDSGDGLAIAALIVGALGLITGGIALVRTRSKS